VASHDERIDARAPWEEVGVSTLTSARLGGLGRDPGVRYRWTRFWAVWLVTVIVSGVAGDVTAYVSHGYPATLTMHIRWWTGLEPQTRFHRIGQALVMAFLSWAAVHLGLGVLGPSRGRYEP
jgi:hypothetical protein